MERQTQDIEKENTIDSVWDTIIENSNEFNKSFVFNYSEKITPYQSFKNIALNALDSLMNKPLDLNIINIYIDGAVISDPCRFLEDNPKRKDENIEEWKNRILPNKTLVVKVDKGIMLSDKLHYALEEFLAPIINKRGIPLGGINATLEFGDHKWSPDGLEEDLTSKNKFLLNLSNTDLTLFEWTPIRKEEIGGLIKKKGKVQNFADYLDNYSEKNIIHEDELVVMSNQGMYIIQHEGFYFCIKILLNDLTNTELLQQSLFGISAAAMSSKIRGDEASILPVYDMNKHDEFTQEILKNLQYSSNDLNLPIKELLKKSFKDTCYGRRSNRGFLGIILPKEDIDVANVFRDITKDAKIVLLNPVFKIQYYAENNYMYVFMRGQKTVVKYSNLAENILEAINEGAAVTWGMLSDDKDNEAWNDAAVKKLIQLAYKYRTIDIISS